MARSCRAVALAVLIAPIPVGWAVAAEGPMTNADVVRLTQAGVGESVIVAMIESSETDFDTGVDSLLELAEADVADAVIAAMVAAGTAPDEAAAPGRPASAAVPAARAGTARDARAAPRAIPGSTFREALSSGGEGPEMVVIPAGRFRMGCLSNDGDCLDEEKPVHQVSIAVPFALSVHEVTFGDYDRFTYPNKVDDEGWGRGRRPVINVSWDDAKEYVAWLSAETGAEYRLPSEAEWEYAARAGASTKYGWGNEIGVNRANCLGDNCGDQWEYTAPVGSFAPNGFGLHDMHGNVWEWVEDCWNGSYAGAPSNGGAWLSVDCTVRVLRGGSWLNSPRLLRAAYRDGDPTGSRFSIDGFRVARTLTP